MESALFSHLNFIFGVGNAFAWFIIQKVPKKVCSGTATPVGATWLPSWREKEVPVLIRASRRSIVLEVWKQTHIFKERDDGLISSASDFLLASGPLGPGPKVGVFPAWGRRSP